MESCCTKCFSRCNDIQCNSVDREGRSLRYLIDPKTMFAGGRNLPCWKHYRIFTKRIGSHNVTIDDLNDYDALRRQAKRDTKFVVIIKSPFAWLSSDAVYHRRVLTEKVIHEYVSEWQKYVNKWEQLWRKHPDRVVLLSYEHMLKNISSLRALSTILLGAQIACMQKHILSVPSITQSNVKNYDNEVSYYLKCKYMDTNPTVARVAMHFRKQHMHPSFGSWKYVWNDTCVTPV